VDLTLEANRTLPRRIGFWNRNFRSVVLIAEILFLLQLTLGAESIVNGARASANRPAVVGPPVCGHKGPRSGEVQNVLLTAILPNVPEVSASPCAESRRERGAVAAGLHGLILGRAEGLFIRRAQPARRFYVSALVYAALPALRS
jgi:hypothetical protein